MQSFRTVLMAGLSVPFLAMTLAESVHAQGAGGTGFYGKGFIGATFPDDVTIRDEAGVVTPNLSADDDISFGAAVGMKYGNNIRAELELANRAQDVSGSARSRLPDALGLPATSVTQSVTADITVTSLMLNGYFDVPVSPLVALFGFAGLGVAFIDTDDLDVRTEAADSTLRVSGDTRNEFAWQVGVGAAYEVAPDVTLELLYRYLDFGTGESEVENNDETAVFGQAFDAGRSEFDVKTQEVAVGVRFAF